MFEFIAEALYFAVDTLYMSMFEGLLSYWEESVAAFNSGQVSIYFQSLESALLDWLDGAQSDWPYADADYYAESMFSAYDSEVTYRAFSETIMDPVDQLWETIYTAQELYELAEMFDAMSVL